MSKKLGEEDIEGLRGPMIRSRAEKAKEALGFMVKKLIEAHKCLETMRNPYYT
ncbi:hypothetical protein SESBI_02627 [Sesbania bispinosa]|nr:hypothetical protein SESBI_02627 [Sesbania bispinosa]